MRKTFDNEKYYELQKIAIEEALNNGYQRNYLEIGGKFFDDLHASRVLSGFDSNIKLKIIKDLNIEKEFIVCISARSISKRKKRRDNKKYYTTECMRIIRLLNENDFKFNVAITRYDDNNRVKDFIKELKELNIKPYILNNIKDYPENKKNAFGENGLITNDYIPCRSKLVCIIAPGPDSGKFATCVSQIYHDQNNNIKSTYRKFETFLIPQLHINNPINLACSMAMVDVPGDDCIDDRYFKKTGEMCAVDERDKMTFELLYDVLPEEEKKIIGSISETFINKMYDCIIDLEAANNHAKKEIMRRYKEYTKLYRNGKMKKIEFDEAERIKMIVLKGETLTDTEMDTLFKQTIDFWGYDCQSNVCIEELSELIHALCRYKREAFELADDEVKNNVLEELADVHNMIVQMELYFGRDKIEKIRTEKALRTRKLLAREMLEAQLKEELK